jgi:Zn-dependent protease/CBS domain-containing protein
MSQPRDSSAPRRGLRLGAVAGIPIRLDPSWLVIFGLVAWSIARVYLPSQLPQIDPARAWLGGFCASALLFTSVVIHELSHALMARRKGIPVADITLFLFGGVSRIEEEPRDPKTELLVAIVGPLTSFALAGVFWLIARNVEGETPALGAVLLHYVALLNLSLGAFNLVPAFPLDGGRVLRAAVWWRTGSLRRATHLASNLGRGFAFALMALGVIEMLTGSLVGGLWLVFIGLFLRSMSTGGMQEVALRSALEGVDVEAVMIRAPVRIAPSLTLRELVDEHLLHEAVSGYPVCEGDKVVGAIAVSQLIGLPAEELAARRVADVMRPVDAASRVAPDESLLAALNKMMREQRKLLLVMRGESLCGIVTFESIHRLLELREVLTRPA